MEKFILVWNKGGGVQRWNSPLPPYPPTDNHRLLILIIIIQYYRFLRSYRCWASSHHRRPNPCVDYYYRGCVDCLEKKAQKKWIRSYKPWSKPKVLWLLYYLKRIALFRYIKFSATLRGYETVKLYSWTPKQYLLIPLGLGIMGGLHDGVVLLPLPECFANFLSCSDFYSLMRIE
jgi:hypothetical protein